MNKVQLIRRIAAELNASQTSIKPVVEQILQQIHIALSEGEKIFLPQFGTFELIPIPLINWSALPIV